MGAATTLGRLHGPHAGSNWFAGAATFGFLSAALLWFISDRYLVPAHLVTWFLQALLVNRVVPALLGVVGLRRTPAPRPWSAWAAAVLLALPLLMLLMALVWMVLRR